MKCVRGGEGPRRLELPGLAAPSRRELRVDGCCEGDPRPPGRGVELGGESAVVEQARDGGGEGVLREERDVCMGVRGSGGGGGDGWVGGWMWQALTLPAHPMWCAVCPTHPQTPPTPHPTHTQSACCLPTHRV